MEEKNESQLVQEINIKDKSFNKKVFIIFIIVLGLLITATSFYYLPHDNVVNTPLETTETETETEEIGYSYDFKDDNIYYEIENGNVYYYQKLIVDIDTETFVELGNRWAKDKNSVYWEGIKQDYLDSSTIQISTQGFIGDKNNVWSSGNSMYQHLDLTDLDPKTFEFINWLYAKDVDDVYYIDKEIIGADPNSFQTLNSLYEYDFNTPVYTKDNNNIYYRGEIVSGVDHNTFVYLGGDYSKDKDRVYFRKEIIESADSDSFAITEHYGKDNNNLYSSGKIIDLDVDTSSFEIIYRNVIKDKNSVYFSKYDYSTSDYIYEKLENADAQSFSFLETCRCVEKSCSSYFVDKDKVFVDNVAIESIDRETFEFIDRYSSVDEIPYTISFSRDKNNVYRNCGKVLEGANTETFEIFKDGVIQNLILIGSPNKEEVFYIGDIIPVRWTTIGNITGSLYMELIDENGDIVPAGLGVAGPELNTWNGLYSLNTAGYSPGKYKIYISTYGKGAGNESDYSDKFFILEDR